MNEITMVLFAVYAAAVSLVLYVILERVFSLKIRMILLPFCAMILAIFVVMINPQYETGLLFMLNVILAQLLIPFLSLYRCHI